MNPTDSSSAAGGILWSRAQIDSRLRTVLAERGLADAGQLDRLAAQAGSSHKPLEELLVTENVVEEETVLRVLGEITGLKVIDLGETTIEAEAIGRVSPRIVAQVHCMPVTLDGDTLTLASDHARDVREEDRIRLLLNCPVSWVLCPREDLHEGIKHFYGIGLSAFLGLTVLGEAEAGKVAKPPVEASDMQAFTREILHEAIRTSATDIHVEPYEDELRIRFRIDGSLYPVSLPEGVELVGRQLISGLKVLGQLNVAEHRLPQDGRFSFDTKDESFDIRMSVLPTRHGESVTLRILNRTATFLTMDQIGLEGSQRKDFQELLSAPHGMVLFTGPTGSGKTTSLYAALADMNTQHRKIVTMEDPVEYQMHGITQLQVHTKIGFTFAAGLRSVLRHDPDVVLIGEIRDPETAEIAVSAALTGHLVLSTLHTNDAASALARLIDIGIEPYLAASSVQGVIAQRLVRRLCPDCREAQHLEGEVLARIPGLGLPGQKALTVYRERGCPHCRYTGFRGRQAIYEVMPMSSELSSLTAAKVPSDQLAKQAVRQGLITLRESGWAYVHNGVTTVDEVLRVTQETIR